MKKITLFFVSLLIFIVGCESHVNQSNNTLIYKGISVSKSSAPFLTRSVETTARITGTEGELIIGSAPPTGTVYGHEDYPKDVYLAQGDEVLPSGSWIDQMSGDYYETTLLNDGKITFQNKAVVTIRNAINTYYLDANENWVLVTSDTTAETKSIQIWNGDPSSAGKISTFGSANITTNASGDIGGGGGIN